jgi:hypothetical protein
MLVSRLFECMCCFLAYLLWFYLQTTALVFIFKPLLALLIYRYPLW